MASKASTSPAEAEIETGQRSQFYSFSSVRSNGDVVEFSRFTNKVVMVVNVASLCGFTPQYHELETLHQKYHHLGLEILAFPCNQFGSQEPLEEKEVETFAKERFGVTFPIMTKIHVNGHEVSPVYAWLKDQKQGALGFKGVRWNFEKFILDRNGNVQFRFPSAVTPLRFEQEIVRLLEQN